MGQQPYACGADRASSRPSGPNTIATESRFYPDTEGVMGWNISERGFQIVLQATVPKLVHAHIRDDVDQFLSKHHLSRADIDLGCATRGPQSLRCL